MQEATAFWYHISINHCILRKISQEIHARVGISLVYAGTQVMQFAIVDHLEQGMLRHLCTPYRTIGQEADPIIHLLVDDSRALLTVCRHEVFTDGQWHGSELFNEYYKTAGLDDVLYSKLRLPSGLIHRLAFGRALGDSAFSAAEKDRVAQFHRQILNNSASEPAPLISERARRILHHLMSGQGEKEIARLLGLSVATVHREVLRIYRHYGVHRKVELVSRLSTMDVEANHKPSCISALSRRERQVFSFLLAGATEREAASMLNLSVHTLHEYTKSMYQALGVSSRAQLVAEFGGLYLSC